MAEAKQVLIVGGTHGNERTGLQLVRHLNKYPEKLQRDNFTAQTLIANESAIAKNIRYIDQDLNRCFSNLLLDNKPQNTEQSRAHEINRLYGPKGSATKTDWILDLHTTTSNMGVTLIVLQHDPVGLDMALYIQQRMPSAAIFCQDPGASDNPYLCSIARHGFQIEIGPVPQGLLRWDIYDLTRQTLSHALDFIDLQVSGKLELPDQREAEVYEFIEKVHLPRDENGVPTGMIHPNVQDSDYQQLSPGEPIFMLDTGEPVLFDYPEPVHVAFVNEAAYYDQSHAVSLMRKKTIRWQAQDH